MRAYIDTNIIIRHFTGDPPDRAELATAFLERVDELPVTVVVASFDRGIDRVPGIRRVAPKQS